MADPVIQTEGLVKRYGRHPALQGLDLTVRSGEVFGFLGPNGAGKTTTIRLLLDLLRPTRGQVRVLGSDPRAGGPGRAGGSATCRASCASRAARPPGSC